MSEGTANTAYEVYLYKCDIHNMQCYFLGVVNANIHVIIYFKSLEKTVSESVRLILYSHNNSI